MQLLFTQISLMIGDRQALNAWVDWKKNWPKSAIDRCSIRLSRYSFSIRTLALQCNTRPHTMYYHQIIILRSQLTYTYAHKVLHVQRLFLFIIQQMINLYRMITYIVLILYVGVYSIRFSFCLLTTKRIFKN